MRPLGSNCRRMGLMTCTKTFVTQSTTPPACVDSSLLSTSVDPSGREFRSTPFSTKFLTFVSVPRISNSICLCRFLKHVCIAAGLCDAYLLPPNRALMHVAKTDQRSVHEDGNKKFLSTDRKFPTDLPSEASLSKMRYDIVFSVATLRKMRQKQETIRARGAWPIYCSYRPTSSHSLQTEPASNEINVISWLPFLWQLPTGPKTDANPKYPLQCFCKKTH